MGRRTLLSCKLVDCLLVSQSENDRRILSAVHAAFLAAMPVYALVLWFARDSASVAAGRGDTLFWVLAGIGGAQYLIVERGGRRLLRLGRGPAEGRVRAYFLVRFAAAEAIGVFGLIAGFLGAAAWRVAALLALGLFGLALSRPTPTAWGQALEAAGYRPPSVAPSH
jgi:hypothetical protein